MKNLLLWMILPCAIASGANAENASITIDADAAGTAVSPTLYGIFFEDINHAADGGIYAELIRNRSFEDTVPPAGCTVIGDKFKTPTGWETPFPTKDPMPGWTLLREGEADAKVTLDEKDLLNSKQNRCVRLDVSKVAGGTGLANSGFWGIPVKSDESFRLSLYAQSPDSTINTLSVALEDEKGERLASGEIRGVTSSWAKHECTLKSASADKNARLVLRINRPGVVRLDVVSLFPTNTYKYRLNGLRPDLVEMLRELKPAFMRFPGGCIVEGFTPETAWRWKKTIGDIAERPGHWNLWGYRSSDGLGYHELLQLCEDLGAAPMFVVNCGMTCQFRGPYVVPMSQLDEWVQDALDAIEYANGPADSTCGRLRAAAGHPESFHLKYLEIGNENNGPAYAERYTRFYEAIHARYPEIQLIANCHFEDRPMQIRDDHYYNSTDFFIYARNMYDAFKLDALKVYVGEYAVVGPEAGQGNLRGAVAEAAFLMGLERNSRVVTMSSYAPLFVNVHDRTWNPNSICFDNTTCYGTPSHHLQTMFAHDRPDVCIPCNVQCEEKRSLELKGGIGLSTWATQAEFKDIRVTQGERVLYASDFARGTEGWKRLRGDWQVADGAYRQKSDGQDMRVITGHSDWTRYTIELSARKLSGSEGFLILFAVRDEHNWCWWNLGGWNNQRHGVEYETAQGKAMLGAPVDGKIETNRWYKIRIEVGDTAVRCYLDGKKIHDLIIPSRPVLVAAAGRDIKEDEIILKVVNVSDQAQEAAISITPNTSIGATYRRILLASSQPTDENSLREPRKVFPRTEVISNEGKSFKESFLPNSITVLRIKTR